MAQDGTWQKRLGFWVALCVVTAAGTFARLRSSEIGALLSIATIYERPFVAFFSPFLQSEHERRIA